MSLFLLVLLMYAQTCCATDVINLEDYYVRYPANVVPNVDKLREYADLPRFEVYAFDAALYIPDKDSLTAREILLRMRFTDEFYGFVFNSTNYLQYVLVRKAGISKKYFTGYTGQMDVASDGSYYWEKLPTERKDWIVNRVYGEQTVYEAVTRVNASLFIAEKHCMLTGTYATPDMCSSIQKCFGYLVDSGENCILSHIARELLIDPPIAGREEVVFVVHKRFQKTILTIVQQYRQLVVFILLVLWDAQLALYNFDLGGACIRNLTRKYRA